MKCYSTGLTSCQFICNAPKNLRHDAREVEHLSWQVGHVAVQEDEKRLDDTRVGREAWREGGHNTIDGSHRNTTTRNHQEGDESEETIHHCHCAHSCKLLKKVVQHLEERGEGEREGMNRVLAKISFLFKKAKLYSLFCTAEWLLYFKIRICTKKINKIMDWLFSKLI